MYYSFDDDYDYYPDPVVVAAHMLNHTIIMLDDYHPTYSYDDPHLYSMIPKNSFL
jgi:hypothetical protein